MGAITPGVRLHDLPQGTVEERIRMAGELGFSCIQLPSKVLYASMGIDRSGLTRELADHLRAVPRPVVPMRRTALLTTV